MILQGAKQMINSMTGYGRGESKGVNKSFIVEMKSVNHRYTDIVIRMSKKFSPFEEKIRNLIKDLIKRGRIEVYINYETDGQKDIVIRPNIDLTRQYFNGLSKIKTELGLNDNIDLKLLTNFPDIFEAEEKEDDVEDIWNILKPAINDALDSLMAMRKTEGIKLATDIKNRCTYIKDIVKQIEQKAPQVVKEYKNKLIERISDLTEDTIDIDENRLALEVSIFADKSNITEEIVRLYSHIEQLLNIFNDKGAVGRKLDFLMQEMNREINTIGSKSSDIEISNLVIEVKSELEKIREQVQNIE